MKRAARPGLRGAVVIAAGAAVLTGSVAAALLTGPTEKGTSALTSPSGAATPTTVQPAQPVSRPTASTSAAPAPASPRSADAVVASFVNAADTLSPTSDLAALRNAVSGEALSELQAQQLEFKANGWTATGTTRVTDLTVLRTTGSGANRTVEVRACVDSSKVRVLTAAGKPAFPTTTGSRRALNLYDLQDTSAGWRVIRHSYPADPAC